MLRKIGVILRGHRRTWDYTKKTILEFFDDKAEVVDYYVSWWRTGSASDESIKQDFTGRRLRACILTDEIRQYCDPYYAPSFLSNLLIRDISHEELLSGEKYELIIETRPDVVHHYNNAFKTRWFCPDNAIGFTYLHTDDQRQIHGLTDHCYIGKSHSLFLFNTKVHIDVDLKIDPPLVMGHHTLYKRCMDYYKMESFQIPWFNSFIVRPPIYNLPTDDFVNFYRSGDIWNTLSKDERVKILEKADIPLGDYDLHLDTYLVK